VVDGTNVRDVTSVLDALPSYRHPLPPFDVVIAHLDSLKERIDVAAAQSTPVGLDDVVLLSPVANPGKIIGAPVNYQKHLEEVLANPQLHHQAQIKPIHKAGLFLKATSSLVGPGQGIALRMLERRNDHEVELAVVMGRPARQVSSRDALAYVAGYSIGLDITIRGPEERSLRKSPDSYTVLGPSLVTADEIPEPNRLDLRIAVNGELRQSSNTRNMILGVPELIEYASSFYTLYPGDVIVTGTPEGVSPIVPGDRIEASIERVGTMTLLVRAA
jgi:2-keto-4-pentenoate hydratase/2-oxohepta-3-ene-1,7-dioic acid hydratase in catechol pathway